jgi:hypothetical protein
VILRVPQRHGARVESHDLAATERFRSDACFAVWWWCILTVSLPYNAPADITAKNTSQYIFASLFGTVAGVSCCAYIGQSAPLALLCFSGLAYTSMYSAYRTVKAIPLPTLNSTRLQLLAARWVGATALSVTFPGPLRPVRVCACMRLYIHAVAFILDRLKQLDVLSHPRAC